MKKNIFDKSLFAIRMLIVVLCVICGAVPAWAHGTHYARVTVTASPTANGKVYMTTDANKVPASGDWVNTMSEDWNCDDGIGPSEEDKRTYYVHAQAESGYHFVKWSSNGTDSKSTEAKYAYITSASGSSGNPTANNIYAIFEANPTYTVTFLTSENGSYTYQYGSAGEVTVTTEQSVETNLNFALTATPDAGYELYGWYTESGGVKTYFDHSSYSLPSYALPGNVRIGVDFMPIGTPLFQIKEESAVYTDLNAAVTACGGVTKTIVLINNGTLPAGEYTIPMNVTLLIPFDAAYTCYTATPALTSNTWIAPTAYRTLTMSPGAHLTVNGKISVSAKLSSKSFHGPCGAPSGTYGAIQMLSEGETKSTITLNNGAKLYSWGYIYGEGKVDALSGSTVYEGFTLMDWRGGQHTLNIYNARNTYKVFPFNQYYIQNIEVPLTMHKGATESVYSSIYGDGNDYDLSITIVGESAGLFRLTGTGATLTKWYDPQADRQHFEMVGQAQISAISFSIMGQTMSSSAFVLPINNNMDITVKNGATVAISEDVCIMPDASITVEQGATMNIASGKNVYIYDKNAYTNAGSYSTSRGGYPSVGPGRYGGADYIHRMKYSPSWATTPSRELRRLQNMGSARFQINGTLNVNGKLYTTEGGADIHSNTDGAAVILAGGAGTAQYTYQVDCEDVDPGQTKVDYYYSIPITSAQLHNADASYVETAGSAANASWTYANGHWGWCILWTLEDGTELKRMYQPAQPNDSWLSSNAPSTDRADEGTCSYVFNGWNTTTDTDNQEIIVVAGYTKNCEEYYTVTWKSEDGIETLETDENVGQGEATRFNGTAPTKAIDPVQSKVYTFDGWSTEPNGGGSVYGIGATPAASADAVYYAHFAVTDVAAVVIANGENTYCTTIEEAFEVANNADHTPTIQVWKNTSATGTLTYTAKNHCTLDLNGYTVTGTTQPLLSINDEGFTVTITDHSPAQEGKLHLSWSSTGNVYVVQITSGVLCLEAGTIHGQNTGSGATAGVYANNRQEVIMTGGKIQMETAGTCYGIFAQGKATVSGGTIQVASSGKSAYAIQAYGANGNAIINDGYFSATGKNIVTCVDTQSSASAVVQGGYFNTNANLDTYKAATCRVYNLPSTKLPYRYTVTEKTPLVASVTINSVTTEYSSFADAWTAANTATAASTLTLLDDVDITDYLTYNNASGKNCTFDLNGHTISGTGLAIFNLNTANITFTVTDNSDEQQGKLLLNSTGTSVAYGVMVSKGTFVLNGGTIEAHIKANTSQGVRVANGASFTMNGGIIDVETTNSKNGDGVFVNTTGTATINGGTVRVHAAATGYAVNVVGTTTIMGGKFYASGSSAACVYRTGTLSLRGGQYSSDTDLAANCATNYYVFPNDNATYPYKVAEAYNLTWTTDGELSGEGYTPSGLTEVGTSIVAPTSTKEGYVFAGWTPTVAATMPTANTTYTATWAVASVTIGETTTLYTTFDAAWNAVNSASAASTLKLLQNVSITSCVAYNNSYTQNCTLDLNGHVISGSATPLLQITQSGITFTITDLTEAKEGRIECNTHINGQKWAVEVSKSTLRFEGGTIYAKNTQAGTLFIGIYSGTSGVIEMSGGNIHTVTTAANPAYGVLTFGTATISGGSFKVESSAAGYAVEARNANSNVTITGGNFYATGSSAACVHTEGSGASLTLQGGYYNSDTNLETCVTSPYHVLPNDDATYLYKVAEGYTVTFNTNDHGTAPEAQLIEKNAHASEPTAPTATGYTFGGWYKETECTNAWDFASDVVTQATTLFAKWTLNTYTINYELKGGSVASENPTSYTVESSAITLNNPTKANYVFAGWTGTGLASATMNVTISAGSTGNRSYTATWTPAVASVTISGSTTYYATFADAWTAASGAESASTITLLDDVTGLSASRTYSAAHNLTLDLNGHTLSGSSTDASLFQINSTGHTFTVTDGSANQEGMISFTATGSANSYCVMVNNGTFVLNAGKLYAESASNNGVIGCVQSNGGTFTMNENGALHAKYTGSAKNGRAVHANGGTTTIDGGTIRVESQTDGMGFVYSSGTVTVNSGWFSLTAGRIAAVTNQNAGNAKLNIRGGYYSANNNTYLTPHVKTPYHIFANADAEYPQKVAEGYTVTFNNYDGTSLQSGLWEKGAIPAYSGTPTKPADAQYTYTFNGWSPAISSVTASATYTATYSSTVNNYTVTVVKNVDDYGSISSTEITSVPYGSSITVEGNTFTVNGTTVTATPETSDAQYTYTFDGWTNAPGTVTGDVTITANFTRTVNNYTVLWKNADGTTLETDEDVPYGTTPTYDGATPTKATDEEGIYTFNGWSPAVGAITDNTEYTATYSTTPVVASVTISGATTYYTTFNAAWSAANSATAASTIKLLSNITATSILTYNNSNTQDCTLDLNGHTISSTQQAVLNPTKAGITFTLTDNSENHNGKLLSNATSTSAAYGVLVSAGTFVMENGTIEAHLLASISQGVRVANGASLTMNGGTIEVETTNNKSGCGVFANTTATATINGGTIRMRAAAKGYAVNIAGTTTITGGRFYATGTSAACVHIDGSGASLTLQGGYYSTDTNLSTACATNYHVFPNSDATYRYKVAEGYTVNFNNYDGTALQTGLWEKNTTPVYSGDTPTKPEDAQYTYAFSGWDPEVVAVTADATYIATYTATPKPQESIVVNEDETRTIDNNTTTTTTIVHVSGTLEVAENVTLTTNDLILEATPSSSGEILGDVAVTQNAYFDLSQPGGFKAKTWYAIAVPWQVEVPAYALGDVSLSNDGENYTPQTLGTTFDLIYYNGALRATGASKAWNYVEDDPAAEHIMVPGRAYMIYLTANTNVIRFRKSTSTALHTNELDVVKYPSSVDANYADWNGIANPATFKAFLNVGTTENLGQVYNADTKQYTTIHLNSDQLQVGQPIFVQPIASKTVVAERDIHPSAAPRRAKANVTPFTRYEVALSSADDQVADRIIVRMDEDKETDAYTVGQDLAKMGLSTVVPQMWVNRYHTQLCVNTAFPTNNRADYPLALFAPAAGEYTIAITGDPTLVNNDAMLYLTYDGRTIWNLSHAPYSLSLESGTNTHYGLRIVYARQTATGIENVQNDNVQFTKVLMDDHVFIIRGGNIYTMDGQLVK